MSAKKAARKSAKKFTAEERAAMKERAKELRAGKADGESAVLEKIRVPRCPFRKSRTARS